MSKIDKLSILGVRSFDNVRSETIQFHTPLTLIVGMNGSGKTTIIECLKYATTGDLPPNAKGGAFVHDPKLCGEKEVLAQVKVSFKSTQNLRMVCTRNLQLTVKKNARTMKTLEGNLLMLRDGERFTMSSRVAEMDVRYSRKTMRIYFEIKADCLFVDQTMMPQYLGVSKAVLDSVIFCHQEESLWPMAEPSKLKERFDKIFEALKYTKAIDNIKVLQKKKKEDLVGFKKDQEHTKVIKDKADKLQRQTDGLYQEIEDLRKESDGKGAHIREAARKAEKAWRQGETVGMIVGELTGKRIEKKTKEESVQSLRQNLTEMSDSDEELQRMLEQYEERVQAYEDDLETQKDHYGKLTRDSKEAGNRVSAKERECGSYEAQKDNYDRQIKNREKLVKETARSHNIRGFDLDVDDAQVQAFMERISKMARDQNAAFERARRETSEELQRAQKALNQINEKKSVLNQRKESARQTISTNDKKITSLQGDLNKINIDEGGKVTVESNLSETEAKLESAKSDIGSQDWDSNIGGAESDLRKLEDRKEKLDAELVEGTRQAGDSARLDFVQKELKDRQKSLETMTGAHGEKIGSTVGQGWTPTSVEPDFQRAVDQSASQVAEAERQRDGTSREMEQVEYKLNTDRSNLKSKRHAFREAENAIRNAVGVEPADYPEEVKKIEESRDVLKSDDDSFSRVLEYLESCIKVAKDKNCCRTCNRSFKDRKDADTLLKIVGAEKKKYEGGESIKNELAQFEEDLKAAKGVSSDYDTWERLMQKEIPALEKSEKELADSREKLITQVEDQDATVRDRQAAKRDVDVMGKTVQNIARYHADIASFETQIEELVAKQKAAGLSRGLEIIQDEVKKVNEEARAVKARLAKSTGDRDRSRTLINKLELEVRDIKSKLAAAEYQLKEKKSLEQQIENYKSLSNEQREHVKSIDKELQDLVPQLSQAQAKYDDIAQRGAQKDRELQDESKKLDSSLNQLKMANEEINSYIERGGPQQLARAQREVQTLKGEVTSLEQEQQQVVRRVKSLEEQLRNHSETKRSIQDNQRYRRDLRQLETVRAEIEQLETHNAEDDKAYYEREGSKWQMERNKIAAEQATIIGSLKSKDNQLEQYLKEYQTEYKDAATKYREAIIMVETTKACVDDLGRYGGALDKAIMKYHSMKMDDVNRIIEELWRNTYQGTDVDTIMIRSESENVKSNKSYNYRVVMVKQDAEMDMRGRCSAGQKVLASIIIRLALAECFGRNCGIIALDEPTTNLDIDNIKALAESLAKIIRNRRQQKNFQLIVITHDEEFLRHMGCSDFADVYYCVSRNEKQKSMIERQSIAEVGRS